MKGLKRQSRWVLLVATASALLMLWLLWPQDPAYKGKSLGYWLDQVDGRFATPAAQVAFNQMGEKAVPALFQRVRNEDALTQRIYSWTWSHLPEALQEKITAPEPGGRALHNRVAVALSLTGPPAAPALVKALDDSDGRVRLVATGAIGMMGSRAEVPIPALVRLLHDQNFDVRATAVLAIDRMGPKRKEAVPALTSLLSERLFLGFRGIIATSLGTIGPDACEAVPELRKLLHDPDPDLRERTALALWRITADTNMVTVLVAELEQTSDPQLATRLMNDLAEIGPAAKAAVPLLSAKAQDQIRVQIPGRPSGRGRMPNRYGRTVDLSDSAKKALNKIDPEAVKNLARSSFKVLDLKEAKLGEDSGGK